MKTIIFVLGLFFGAAIADSDLASVESAIYKIEIPYLDGVRVGLGTGVLVTPDKVLTNCHVLRAHPGWPVAVQRKTNLRFSVAQHYALGSYDACILQGDFAGTPLEVSSAFSNGEPVFAYGYLHGTSAVGHGNLLISIETDMGTSILSAIFCDKGSSGGPLLNAKGQLIGLNYGHFENDNRCLSIPVSLLQPYFGR